MNPHDIDWERLDRYVAGEGTAEEREALRCWVESDRALQVAAEVMRTAQRLPGGQPAGWSAERSWAMVAERLGLPSDAADVAGRARISRRSAPARPVLQLSVAAAVRRRRAWRIGLGVAAAAFVAMFGVERGFNLLARGSSKPVAGATMGRAYVTARGQRLVVHLPDRTQVTLAPESRLELAADYGRGGRVVHLQGQAYFIVTHDETKPFDVRAGALIARDLGTRFVVRAYPGDTMPSVVVAEGLVALASSASGDTADENFLLHPGDLGRVTATGGLTRTRGVAVDSYLAWTAGELQFRGLPLRDVMRELARWYDVDVRLAEPSLEYEQVTASFKDESASSAIDQVAAANGLVVDQQGAVFTLRRPRH